jgi:protein phosphatase
MLREIFCGKTDIGLRRSNNEDVFITSSEQGFCLAADGMGGEAAGELASKIFADTAQEIFADNFNHSEKEILYRVKQAFSFANEKILDHVTQTPNHKGMGCTAELLAFYEDNFALGHVGDSRTYRFRNGQLRQLTQDHTLVQQQIEEGLISSDNIRNHPLRNVILRAIGQERELALDLLRGEILPGDLFLLCSDGLTDMIQDNQIQKILHSDIEIHGKADKLIESAKAAGGKDNITVVLAAIT